jgi:hypothetical protein
VEHDVVVGYGNIARRGQLLIMYPSEIIY